MFFGGGYTIPPIAGPGMAHRNVRMKSRWLTRGPMHVTYTKRAPEAAGTEIPPCLAARITLDM